MLSIYVLENIVVMHVEYYIMKWGTNSRMLNIPRMNWHSQFMNAK